MLQKHKKRLKGLHSFLEKQNHTLAQHFGSRVLNHKKYLGMPSKKAYKLKNYLKLFSDSVHFKDNVYSDLVQRIAVKHLIG